MEDELLANKWEPPAITSTSSSAVSKKESNRHYNRGKASKQWTMNPGDVVRQAAALASRIQKQPALQKVRDVVMSIFLVFLVCDFGDHKCNMFGLYILF